MVVQLIRSDKVYQAMLRMPVEARRDYFRKHVLEEFRPKFACQKIPFEGAEFDVFSMLGMTHYLPEEIGESLLEEINAICSEKIWKKSLNLLETIYQSYLYEGIIPPVSHYNLTLLLGRADSKVLTLSEGLLGDGGIPGYMVISLVPNEKTLDRLQAVIAHEMNHNIRYQYIKWSQDVTLAEWVIAEGLAENFVESLFGPDYIGPWVKKNTLEVVEKRIKPKMKDKLNLSGMQAVMPYIYGDEISRIQGGEKVDLPYAAGYTLGYYLVKYYLEKTQQSIFQATILPAKEILKEVKEFWD